jgi:metallo-beta-lactamase family protein
MMEAGRVKHHLANNISDASTTILGVGYCSPTTLGARILRGDKQVSIHGKPYQVNAEIKRLDSFSGHGDYEEMVGFLNCQDKELLQQTILVHGEYEAQQKYKTTLEGHGFKNISIPDVGDEIEI